MPSVIFVTAYDSFAVRAFEAHAVDYLVKPLHEDRFHEALARVYERHDSKAAVDLALRLSELLRSRGQESTQEARGATRLVIPDTHGDVVLDVDEIDWIEAYDYYAAIHTRGRRILMRESLEVLEGRLSSTRFIRVHRSAIVNLARVREIRVDRGQGVVLLNNGVRVPLSRRRRGFVAEAVRRFAG
jgi:two-component system LytT family response regulator